MPRQAKNTPLSTMVIDALTNPVNISRGLNTLLFFGLFIYVIPSLFGINGWIHQLYTEKCSSIFNAGSILCNKLSYVLHYQHTSNPVDVVILSIDVFLICAIILSPIAYLLWTKSFMNTLCEIMWNN